MLSNLHKELLELEARQKIHQLHGQMLASRIAEVRERFQEECPHDENSEERTYFSGGYYDAAFTEITVTCSTCAKVLRTERNNHGHYG